MKDDVGTLSAILFGIMATSKIVVVKATKEETACAGSYAKYKATCGALEMFGATAERAKAAVENFLARSAVVGQWT